MNELSNRGKLALIGALGAGCIVGASGIILVQRLSQKVESIPSSSYLISRELASIHSEIHELHNAIDELKIHKRPQPLKSALRTVTFSDVNESFEAKERHLRPDDDDEDDDHAFQSLAGSSNGGSGSTSTSNTEFFSTISSDEDEFFDIPSDNDEKTNNDVNNGITEEEAEILSLFNRVDDLLEGKTEEQKLAHIYLNEKLSEYKENSEFLWRMCKSHYMMAVIYGVEGDTDKRKQLVFEAVEYGVDSLSRNENCAEAHKWYAIAIGTKGEYLGIREKILDGFEFKKHIDRAAELAPQDHTIQHLLGRFCFEVAELSWWERKMASTLFADPPTATMQEAFDHFLIAEKLKPDGWIENRLFLARCQSKLNNDEEVLKWLKLAQSLPVVNPDDEQAHIEIDTMLAEYNKNLTIEEEVTPT